MRRTSICGLGQVALGPVLSVTAAEQRCRRLTRAVRARAGVLHHPDGRRGAGRVPARPGAPRPRRSRSPAPCTGSRPRRSPRRTRCPASPARPWTATRCGPPTPTASPTGLPGYLEVTGAVLMGAEPDVTVGPGHGGEHAHRRRAAARRGRRGHDRVHRRGHAGHRSRWSGRSPPARAWSAPTRTPPPGAELVPAGRPLRAQDLGMLAAAGVTEVTVHARPRVTIFSTGDEVVPPDTAALRPGPGPRRDRGRAGRAGGRGGRRAGPGRHRARRRRRPWRRRCAPRCGGSDLIVISAGSSVGARDETAGVVRGLGPPGIWCHGLAIKPGKPTLLAECGGVPVIGLPGNPRSALVVFRLLGVPLVRLVGGCTAPPPEPAVRARLARDLASAAGPPGRGPGPRRSDGVATPGVRAVRAAVRAHRRRRVRRRSRGGHRARRGHRGRRHLVPLSRRSWQTARSSATSRRPRPGRLARRARRPRAARPGCPAIAGAGGARRPAWSPPSRCGPPAPRRRSTRPAWTGSRCAPPTPSARARPPRSTCRRTPTTWWTPATRCRTAGTRWSCASTCTTRASTAELRAAVPPYQHVRSIGEDVSAAELLLPEGHRLRAADVAAAAAAAGATHLLVRRRPVVADPADRGRGAADRRADRRRGDHSTPTR